MDIHLPMSVLIFNCKYLKRLKYIVIGGKVIDKEEISCYCKISYEKITYNSLLILNSSQLLWKEKYCFPFIEKKRELKIEVIDIKMRKSILLTSHFIDKDKEFLENNKKIQIEYKVKIQDKKIPRSLSTFNSQNKFYNDIHKMLLILNIKGIEGNKQNILLRFQYLTDIYEIDSLDHVINRTFYLSFQTLNVNDYLNYELLFEIIENEKVNKMILKLSNLEYDIHEHLLLESNDLKLKINYHIKLMDYDIHTSITPFENEYPYNLTNQELNDLFKLMKGSFNGKEGIDHFLNHLSVNHPIQDRKNCIIFYQLLLDHQILVSTNKLYIDDIDHHYKYLEIHKESFIYFYFNKSQSKKLLKKRKSLFDLKEQNPELIRKGSFPIIETKRKGSIIDKLTSIIKK